MSDQTTSIVSKVWGMCNPLRDDGVSYGDYLEQLTYLIFLKMTALQKAVRHSAGLCVVGYEHPQGRRAGNKV